MSTRIPFAAAAVGLIVIMDHYYFCRCCFEYVDDYDYDYGLLVLVLLFVVAVGLIIIVLLLLLWLLD
jgi:hypothetical protein